MLNTCFNYCSILELLGHLAVVEVFQNFMFNFCEHPKVYSLIKQIELVKLAMKYCLGWAETYICYSQG